MEKEKMLYNSDVIVELINHAGAYASE